MSALIVFTIGPVQSYISQARRTQDLWQGSRILSYLAGIGVYKAHDEAGRENVIYPSLPERSPDKRLEADPYASIPNKIVVQWDGNEEGARDCARKMQSAVEQAWQTISQNTQRYFINTLNQEERETVKKIWERQEVNWLECYWVVMLEDQLKSYAKNLEQANDAMGARKLLRNFPQIHEDGRKCSITGEHEALHDGQNVVKFWEGRQQEQRNLALLGKHERLSAIRTIKRFAHERGAKNEALQITDRYPSTSSIAVIPFKYAVLKTLHDDRQDAAKLLVALKAFISALVACFNQPSDLFFTKEDKYNIERFPYIHKKIPTLAIVETRPKLSDDEWVTQFLSIDGDFFFDDTLVSKTIEEYSGIEPTNPKKLHDVQQALQRLLNAAKAFGIPSPQPYLVILSMDGDQMGKTLGVLSDAAQHKKFSETLANFAKQDVRRIVEEEYLGRVVYAGGDDVLALLPVRDALQVADKLRSEFEKTVAAIDVKNHKGEPVTASTGLAYVHHTHNLQDAVRAANNAQKIAKEHYGRNAVGVEFLRRSGEPRSMGHKWVVNGANVVAHIRTLVEAFSNGLSRNLPYDVTQITYSMGDASVPNAALQAELHRILKRRLSTEATTKNPSLAKQLLTDILTLSDVPNSTLRQSWQNTQCWLELARFVAQKEG